MEKTTIAKDMVVMVMMTTMIRGHLKGLGLLHVPQMTMASLPVLIESTILENTASRIGVLALLLLLKT
jgi:hypothetical protein